MSPGGLWPPLFSWIFNAILCYNDFMTTASKNDGTTLTLAEILNLQAIEDAPLDDEQVAMLQIFEREGWSDEECAAYIRKRHAAEPAAAAE